MVMRSSSQSISKGGGWKGILMMVFLTAISVLSLNIFGQTVSFVFLPLIGICLWPRTERVVISIIAILFFGLLLDLLWAGPLGLWALIFLTTFALFRPHLRPKPHSFSSAFLQWLGVLVFALIGSYFLGWLARESRPAIWPLLYQALAATVLFPGVYAMRHLGKLLITNPEMRGI